MSYQLFLGDDQSGYITYAPTALLMTDPSAFQQDVVPSTTEIPLVSLENGDTSVVDQQAASRNPNRVERRRSFSTFEAFVRAIHGAALQEGLSDRSARLLTAFSAHETGGGLSMWNYNIGNAKVYKWWMDNNKPYYTLTSCECRTDQSADDSYCQKNSSNVCRTGQHKRATSSFWQSYSSPREGVQAFLRQLKVSKYRQSDQYMRSGNPEFFRQLARDGWYPESPEVGYSKSLKWLNKINTLLGGAPLVASNGSLASIALIGFAAYFLLKRFR